MHFDHGGFPFPIFTKRFRWSLRANRNFWEHEKNTKTSKLMQILIFSKIWFQSWLNHPFSGNFQGLDAFSFFWCSKYHRITQFYRLLPEMEGKNLLLMLLWIFLVPKREKYKKRQKQTQTQKEYNEQKNGEQNNKTIKQ